VQINFLRIFPYSYFSPIVQIYSYVCHRFLFMGSASNETKFCSVEDGIKALVKDHLHFTQWLLPNKHTAFAQFGCKQRILVSASNSYNTSIQTEEIHTQRMLTKSLCVSNDSLCMVKR